MSAPLKANGVYISYKNNEPRSERVRDMLIDLLQRAPYHLRVIVDIRDLNYMDDLEKFMTRLGQADFVIVILTQQYLESPNCMYELAEMHFASNMKKSVFPIVFDDVQIVELEDRVAHVNRWKQKLSVFENTVNSLETKHATGQSIQALRFKLERIVAGTLEALGTISSIRHHSLPSHTTPNFEEIAHHIHEWIYPRRWKKQLRNAVFVAGALGFLTAIILSVLFLNGSLDTPAALNQFAERRSEKIHQKNLEKYGDNAGPIPQPIVELIHDMVEVRGGTFLMGSEDTSSQDHPGHAVTVNNFRIAKHEVTQEQWQAIMGDQPSQSFRCPKCPVENITWGYMQKFIEELHTLTGRPFRLPTEAEWEFAAKGGLQSSSTRYAGGNRAMDLAWYQTNSNNSSKEVGSKKPNELGIFDMNGNVWEACSDWYESDYYLQCDPKNPTGPESGEEHVFRGGAFDSPSKELVLYYRNAVPSAHKAANAGFRLAMD